MPEITCFVFNEEIVTMDWLYSTAVGGVKLYVKAGDLEWVKEILQDETFMDSDDDERCPSCNSTNLEYGNVYKRWIFLSWLLLSIPLPLFRDRWKCKDCGCAWAEKTNSDRFCPPWHCDKNGGCFG